MSEEENTARFQLPQCFFGSRDAPHPASHEADDASDKQRQTAAGRHRTATTPRSAELYSSCAGSAKRAVHQTSARYPSIRYRRISQPQAWTRTVMPLTRKKSVRRREHGAVSATAVLLRVSRRASSRLPRSRRRQRQAATNCHRPPPDYHRSNRQRRVLNCPRL